MDDPSLPGGDFRMFIQKIALQGFYALGLVEIPGQPKPEANLPMCKAVIDDLMTLREKTEGNLDDGEKQTLEKYLSDLQFHYVSRSGDAAPAGESS